MTLDMVRQLLERHYTVERIALELATTIKRATALVSEIKRQQQEAP